MLHTYLKVQIWAYPKNYNIGPHLYIVMRRRILCGFI